MEAVPDQPKRKGRIGMRAVVVERFGGPEVLVVEDRDVPQPSPGHILVKVAAVGVNYSDIYQREGIGGYHRPLPTGIGSEGAGTITALGEGVTDFAVGDGVAWANVPGSYAEQVLVPATRAVPVPPGIDLQVAAAVMLQGMTAHYLTHSTFPIQDGNVAVVHAAAGGVGLLLTQMVKRRGGVVVATTSTKAKADLALRVGADHVTNYDEFVDAVRRITGERGADVVYDGVGEATFDDGLVSLRVRGMMVLYGASSGQVPPVDPQRLNSGGSLFLTRPTLIHYSTERGELLWRAGDLFEWIAKGELDVRIGGTYPLAEARRAQEDLASRRTMGKLLLIP
jgi:NADPH:quinone reductase